MLEFPHNLSDWEVREIKVYNFLISDKSLINSRKNIQWKIHYT
jgi:hypothetical protein